jgi:hypothetical protein
MYSHPYVTILNIVLSTYLRRDFIIKTNLLCNPTTKVTIRSPLEVKKNVTFLSHSPKPFINFYYHVFHYSFAIHLPFLYVYIYLSPCSLPFLSLCPKTTNSSKNSIKQSIYANKIVFNKWFAPINILRLHLNLFHKSFLFLVHFSCLSLAFSSYIVNSVLYLLSHSTF